MDVISVSSSTLRSLCLCWLLANPKLFIPAVTLDILTWSLIEIDSF